MAPNLAIREDALGPEHPDTATALNNLANLFRDQGDYAEARPNTCADAPRSRSKRRRARISSPRSEWTLGEPFLTLRTCRRAAVSSTWIVQHAKTMPVAEAPRIRLKNNQLLCLSVTPRAQTVRPLAPGSLGFRLL